jgi:hypothetical protein
MEIRHVELRDQHILASRHSELAAQHPELADPLMFSGNGSASDFPYLSTRSRMGRLPRRRKMCDCQTRAIGV